MALGWRHFLGSAIAIGCATLVVAVLGDDTGELAVAPSPTTANAPDEPSLSYLAPTPSPLLRTFLETPTADVTPPPLTSEDVQRTSVDVPPGPRTSPRAQVRALEAGGALPTAAGSPTSAAASWGRHIRRQARFADARRTQTQQGEDSR